MPLLSPSSSSSSDRILVVVNKHLPGITIYDAGTLVPLSQTKMEVAPHEVAVSADGRHAYVPIYGSSGVGRPGTDEHSFHIVRTSDGETVLTLDTAEFKRPHSLAAGPSGIVYMTAEVAGAVVLIDPHAGKLIGHIPTGSFTTHFLALNEAETFLYCSNVQSETISVLDLKERRLAATVPTGSQNQRMTISPDGQWFVTSLGPAEQIAFYRTCDNMLDFTIPVDGRPFVAKFSADGRLLYNVGFKDKKTCVWKMDVASRRVVATFENLGHDPGSLEVSPFTGEVYVSDQPTNTITIMDPQHWTPVGSIRTAPSPDAMAFATVRPSIE